MSTFFGSVIVGKPRREEYLEKIAAYFYVHSVWLRYGEKSYAPSLKDDTMSVPKKLSEYGAKNPEGYKRVKKVLLILMGEESGEGESHTV